MNKNQVWLSKKYLTYSTLKGMWFVSAIWLYFYRLYISNQQIGVLESLAFGLSLLTEIPSGALADRFGRDKVLRLGQSLSGIGLIIQAFYTSFEGFIIGQICVQVGLSLTSGADEALFFDQLKFDKNSKEWRKLVTRGSQFRVIGSTLAALSGGYLFTVQPNLPFILNGIFFTLAAVVIWPIRDTRNSQKVNPAKPNYFNEIKEGLIQFTKPKFRFYVPYILFVGGILYTTNAGILRIILLDRFYFDPFWGSAVLASISLITFGLLSIFLSKAESLSEKTTLIGIGLMVAFSLLVSVINIGWWGYLVILIMYSANAILNPYLSEALNNRTDEDQRATVLSIANFLAVFPYVLVAPIIGYLSDTNQLDYFLFIWFLLIIISIVVYRTGKQKDVFLNGAKEN